jgi:hypothetical protein
LLVVGLTRLASSSRLGWLASRPAAVARPTEIGSKDNTTAAPKIAYPAERVKWLAKDRCLVTVGKADRRALTAFVRAWIQGS